MSHPNPSTAIAYVVVDELIRGGVKFAVASPGSRSAALVLALADRPEIDLVMQLDERSAAFRALGNSVASGRPSVVVTTSGSAVANLLPAVVEADRSAVPLILLTADRPPLLVERRANQTMDQLSIFDSFVRGKVSMGPAVPTQDHNGEWRRATSEAASAALGGANPPGPVHINVAFEEPVVAVGDDGRVVARPYDHPTAGAPGGAQWTEPPSPAVDLRPDLPDLGNRAVVVAGRGEYDPDLLAKWAASRGVPVLATSLSQARGPGAIVGYHHLLVDGIPPRLRPTGFLVVGQVNPAERLARVLGPEVPVVHVDKWGVFSDPSGSMTVGVRSEAIDILRRVEGQEVSWLERWSETDEIVRSAVTAHILSLSRMCGPSVAHQLNSIDWEALVVASSLAVRDVDSYVTRQGWIHSNRGVSGIDGFASTALGVAGARAGTLALAGELSFFHDTNAFFAENIPDLVFVVVDNHGGGLFDLLPQARFAPDFERLFITPQDRDLATLAGFHHLSYAEAESASSLVDAVNSGFEARIPTVVRVPVDRAFDIEIREELDRISRAALGEIH